MTENEYIYVYDLSNVRNVKNVMRNITPEVNECISQEEYDNIIKTLSKWENDIFKKIKVIN